MLTEETIQNIKSTIDTTLMELFVKNLLRAKFLLSFTKHLQIN